MKISIVKAVRYVGLLLLALVLGVILFYSFKPSVQLGFTSNDKLLHTLGYAALGFTLFLSTVNIPSFMAYRSERKTSDAKVKLLTNESKSIILTLSIGTIIGLAIEILQPLTSRSFELLDLAADFLGLLIGLAFGIILLDLVLCLVMDKSVWYDVTHEAK